MNNYLRGILKAFNPNFRKLCFSMLLFMISFNLIMPELNQFISKLGGAGYKGFIIGLFTLSAGLSRPFSGKLSDMIGRKKVIAVGIIVCITVSLIYPLVISVGMLLVLRFFHGFSTGFTPTGATALITDEMPKNIRGRGMGIWGTFNALGIGIGQGLSTFVTDFAGLNGLFLFSGIVALASYIIILNVKETLPEPKKFKWRFLVLKADEIVERKVLPVAVVMFLSATCSGIVFVLVPDMATYLKIENKGWFFLFYVSSTIGVRLFTGTLSDKIGRRQMLIIGFCLLCISMIMIGLSQSILWFTFSAILFGIATGTSSPTIFAWTADLSPENRRGIGAGTMYIALEFGILFGSMVTNAIYENNAVSVSSVFFFGAGAALISVFYLIWHLVKRKSLV